MTTMQHFLSNLNQTITNHLFGPHKCTLSID